MAYRNRFISSETNLTTFEILVGAVSIVFLFWYIQFLWSRRKLYIEAWKLPGPFAWPLIGSAFKIAGNPDDLFKNLMRIAYDNPETFRVWFGSRLYIVTSNPKYMDILLTKCVGKDEIYRFTETGIGHGLFAAPAPKWKINRRLISPAFNQKILNGFVEVFVHNADILCEQLEQYSGKGEFDIFEHLSKYTLDTICETAMGVKVNAQTSDSLYHKWLTLGLEIVFMRMCMIWYHNDTLFQFSKYGRTLTELLGNVHNLSLKVVQEKKEAFKTENLQKQELGNAFSGEKSRWKPFLEHLLQISHDEHNSFTDQQIREEVDTFIIAGSDTTATALSFIFTLMALHPEMQDKLYTEVIDVLGSQKCVQPIDIKHLKYMDLFIKESLRFFPVAPFTVRAVKDDIHLGDFTVPNGSSAIFPFLKTHMDAKYWPNPYKFIPERFLPEEAAKRHPCAYVPFSYGPRNCLGQRYAMMSIKATLSAVIRKFKIFTSYQRIEDIELKCQLLLKPTNGFKVSMERR